MAADYEKAVQRHNVFVLIIGETIVGVLVLVKQQRSILLDNVAVHPDHQGRGLGRQLITLAEQEARNAGFDTLKLYTNELMTENIELYKKLGFVETDQRVEHSFRRVYMQKRV